jgi:hypothetical protein
MMLGHLDYNRSTAITTTMATITITTTITTTVIATITTAVTTTTQINYLGLIDLDASYLSMCNGSYLVHQ